MNYELAKGSHANPEDGMCSMEAVAYLAGEPHSASPKCACPVVTAFCVGFNDGLAFEPRQKLRPYLARTLGTRGDGMIEQRSWMAMDWLIRVYTPTWLSLAGLDADADRLRALPPVLAAENLSRAMGDLGQARASASAAWAAARAGAGAAAWAGARAGAGAAAWDAAGAAAWAGARAGAWAGAWAGARAGAWAAAWDAARAAAWAAAWAAAGAAAWDAAGAGAGAAAWDAAGAALAPTVTELQESAFALLDRVLPEVPLMAPVAEDADLVLGIAA